MARISAALLALALLQAAGPARAQSVSVSCSSNRDGSLSCQRLSDGKWFTCVANVGRTSSCTSNEGETITCIRTGGGVSECSSTARARTGFGAIPDFSVFGN